MTKRNSMGRWRSVTLACLLGVGVGLSTSCGGSASTGTDSHTHWLGHCAGDADCADGLSCLCGICSKLCEAGTECDALGAGATCRVPRSCGSEDEPPVCQKTCTSDDECQTLAPDQVCYQGTCEKADSLPVEPDPCAPMDARDSGDDCLAISGYAFDGVTCHPVICGCAGSDCDKLYPNVKACDDANAACYAELGVTRACEVNTDCVVASRLCCPAPTEIDYVLATNQAGAQSLYDAMCEDVPGCPTIYIPPKPTLYAECVNGQCETIDVGEIAACTDDSDCLLRSKHCCSCGVQPGAGWISVSAPDQYTSFAECDVSCDACLDEPPPGVMAICDPNFSLCGLSSE